MLQQCEAETNRAAQQILSIDVLLYIYGDPPGSGVREQEQPLRDSD